jgi:hypothetical protein
MIIKGGEINKKYYTVGIIPKSNIIHSSGKSGYMNKNVSKN